MDTYQALTLPYLKANYRRHDPVFMVVNGEHKKVTFEPHMYYYQQVERFFICTFDELRQIPDSLWYKDLPQPNPNPDGTIPALFIRGYFEGDDGTVPRQFDIDKTGILMYAGRTVTVLPRAFVIQCTDYRFVEGTRTLLNQKLGLGNWTLMATNGGALPLSQSNDAENEYMSATILNNIKSALETQGVKKVVIVDHEDCHAYKDTFSMDNDPLQLHLDQQNIARNVLHRVLGNNDIQIETMFIHSNQI